MNRILVAKVGPYTGLVYEPDLVKERCRFSIGKPCRMVLQVPTEKVEVLGERETTEHEQRDQMGAGDGVR